MYIVILLMTPLLPAAYSRDRLLSLRNSAAVLSQHDRALITSCGLRRRGCRAGLHRRRRVQAARSVMSSGENPVSTCLSEEIPAMFINNNQLMAGHCAAQQVIGALSTTSTTMNSIQPTDLSFPIQRSVYFSTQPSVRSPCRFSSCHQLTTSDSPASSITLLDTGLSPKMSVAQPLGETTHIGPQSTPISSRVLFSQSTELYNAQHSMILLNTPQPAAGPLTLRTDDESTVSNSTLSPALSPATILSLASEPESLNSCQSVGLPSDSHNLSSDLSKHPGSDFKLKCNKSFIFPVFLLSNIRGSVSTKLDECQLLFTNNNVHIAVFTETWLHKDIGEMGAKEAG